MTPIRPTPVQPTTTPGPASVASARAAFFQALGAAAEAAPVQPAAPAQPQASATAAPMRATELTHETGRLPRPGSILDIRV